MTRIIDIPPASARAFNVAPGEVIRVTDTAGGQPGDFVALRADDLSVHLSQARTRVENGVIALTRGHELWTNTFPPEVMFRIGGDTGGPHDLLYPPCCRYALEKRFGVSRDGCLENLAAALKPWGVRPHEVPDPLNLFFRVAVAEGHAMRVTPPDSAAGSFIELRAAMPCVVAISTCAAPRAGRASTGYVVEVTG